MTFFRFSFPLLIFISVLFAAQDASAQNPLNKAEISDSIDVLHYDINLRMVNLSTHSVSGYTELRVVSKVSNLALFRLWLQQLEVDSVLINGSPAASFSYNDTLISIAPTTAFSSGDTFITRVYYHGYPVTDPSGWGGFYFSADSNFAYNLGVGFESVPHNYGRVWFPCIDDFVDRATYDIHITTKDDRMAVCGGLLISGTDHGDGTKTWHWRMLTSIPTYLASVAVGKYVPVTGTFNGMAGNIPTAIYVRAGDTTNAKNTFIHLNDMLTAFEQRFGPYRFERVGYVGVPFNSGAMEHATNIAYPLAVINGSTAYDDLMSHELSHMWFGDAVTCATAEDMWINEGWARYCEAIFNEYMYGPQDYYSYMQELHKNVVQFTHVEDGGYRAVYGIPAEYTYGSTVYDKGADVAHTLRGYLGDSTFFSVMKKYMDDHAFSHISSAEFRDYLTQETGINMTPFFDVWIFSPGFPHFSVDSFNVSGTGPWAVEVFVRQRLNHAPAMADDNILEVTFLNEQWQEFTDTIRFSGAAGQKTFSVPFLPSHVMMDRYDKISDAITAHDMVIKSTGLKSFPTTNLSLDVVSVSDSAFVRVEHNFVAPDPLKTANPDIQRLSDYRYWKVDGIFPSGFVSKARFRYNRSTSTSTGYLDNTLMTSALSKDSLLLLYRTGAGDDWQVTSFVIAGTVTSGDLIADTLRCGEYTLAIGTPYVSGIENTRGKEGGQLKVFPNPADAVFTIQWKHPGASRICIYNIKGRMVDEFRLEAGQDRLLWTPGNKAAGAYVLKLYDGKDAIIGQEKVVYTR